MAASAELSPTGHDWLDRLPLPAGIIRAGRYVFVNTAFLELLALTREQVLAMRFDDPVAPEDRERVRERHALRLRGEAVPSTYEFDIIRGDGQRRTVEIFVAPGGPETVFQLQEVTERAQRQQHLRALVRLGAAVQREQRDEAIFRAVADGLAALGAVVVRLAPDGDGVRMAEVLAPHPAWPTLARALGPDELKAPRPWTPATRRAWEEGFAFVDDAPLASVRFFGEAFARPVREAAAAGGWARGALLRIDVQGRPSHLLLVVADWLRPEDRVSLALFGAQISAALDAARVITDLSRRNAELAALNRVAAVAGTASELGTLFARACEEVKAVLGAAAVSLFLIEEGGSYARLGYLLGGAEEARPRMERVALGGSRMGEAARSGQPRTFRRAEFAPRNQALLDRMGSEVVVSVPMMARNRAVGLMNVAFAGERQLAPQEEELLLAVSVQLAAAVESSRLVEDLRTSYADLSRTQAQLVRRERLAALGEMAAAVAHEVRNPLGVIFNALVSLRRGLATGQPPEPMLGILTEEAERINHLVSDLLDFARPTQPVLSTEVGLRTAVEEAVRAVLLTAPAPVQLEVRGEAPPVLMDARLMRQVFVNLAENAVQAMPHGGRLEVALGISGSGAESVAWVEFRDTGHGIPAAVLPRIFEPFFTTRARGTGLGLALVKRILEGHRGEVQLRSQPGEGATFTVRWPLGAA